MVKPSSKKEKTPDKIVARKDGPEALRHGNPHRKSDSYLAASVSVITFLIYLASLKDQFVHWDDNHYVLENQHIHSINVEMFRWAFSNFYASNWHPLTWISHAVDYAVWGPIPMGHHLTNNIIHAVNTFLVVMLTIRLLGAYRELATRDGSSTFLTRPEMLIAGGITGFLFGLHPVHVESVAWIAERKDLLCALFFLLSIMTYLRYVFFIEGAVTPSNPASRFFNKWYLLTMVFFILSLLSKPMAVSLPFVLLILDWGLFKRIDSHKASPMVFIEKLPFIILSLLSSVVTILAQSTGKALQPMTFAPLPTRLLVATRSLVEYLRKMVLPFDLIPFYPYPNTTDVSPLSVKYLLPTALVIIITATCMMLLKKHKLWLSVWSYYVVTLIPVLGILQVGQQSMADRYTYLPSLGPFLLIGLTAAWVWKKTDTFNVRKHVVGLVYITTAVLALSFISYLTIKQIGIWKDCIVFWSYIIEKEPARIPVAYSNRCVCLSDIGRMDKALEDCNMAISINPSYFLAYNNLGNIFLNKGMVDSAIADFSKAIDLNPSYFEAYNNRGIALGKIGRLDEAIANYNKAIALNPGFSLAYYNRGLAHFNMHDRELAVSDFQKACNSGLDIGCNALQDLKNMRRD